MPVCSTGTGFPFTGCGSSLQNNNCFDVSSIYVNSLSPFSSAVPNLRNYL